MKRIVRFLFYPIFMSFVLVSSIFIHNPEHFSLQYLVGKQVYKNIFQRPTFEEVKPALLFYSRAKIQIWNNHWDGFEIIEDGFRFESDYWCKYRYIDAAGMERINIDHVINDWKSWEYYILEHDKNFMTQEHLKATKIRQEWMDEYKNPDVEKHRRYQTRLGV